MKSNGLHFDLGILSKAGWGTPLCSTRQHCNSGGRKLPQAFLLGQQFRHDRWSAFWKYIVLLLAVFFIFTGQLVLSQVSEIDQRKVDEIILLDISGSMVRDIRTELLKLHLAWGETDGDRFQMANGVAVEDALARPEMQSVVTNNLLYKSVLCVEAIIDQPGRRNIYIATFDSKLRSLVRTKLPAQISDGLYGPFNLGETDRGSKSSEASRVKSFLAPERNGSYEQTSWRGILAEAVLKGSGPTALYQTGNAAQRFLEKLVIPGYAKMTRQQRMLLFTDGMEEVDKTIPFSKTVENLGKHFTSLLNNGVGFEFTKYYIGNDAHLDPISNPPGWLHRGFVSPRTYRVATGDSKGVTGNLRMPKTQGESVTVVLSPAIRFRVAADDQKPVLGRLSLKVGGQQSVPGLSVQVIPSQVLVSAEEQVVAASIVIQGNLKSLESANLKTLDTLWLSWDLLTTGERIGETETEVEFYTKTSADHKWLPILLQVMPAVDEVTLRCVEPAGQDISQGKPLELRAAAGARTLATFEADFAAAYNDNTLSVELKGKPENSWLKLSPGSEKQVTLAKVADGTAKSVFSLKSEAPPGAGQTMVTLYIKPSSPSLQPVPNTIEVKAMFEPSIIGTTWFKHNGQAGIVPQIIDLGANDMEPTPDASGEVRGTPSMDLVDTVGLEIPDQAVNPAAQWFLTGEHPEAFAVTSLLEQGGRQSNQINHTVKLQVRAKHFFVRSERQVVTNLTAVLEIKPAGNFVFAPHESAGAEPGAAKITIPLRMTAVIPPPPEHSAP